jgi:adenine phosphoribosyltransferase
VPARKPGKLPWEKVRATYDLEYGATRSRFTPMRCRRAPVIVLDDVLATGGTAQAKVELVERLGGEVVGALFVIELTFLDGRAKLDGTDVHALIAY